MQPRGELRRDGVSPSTQAALDGHSYQNLACFYVLQRDDGPLGVAPSHGSRRAEVEFGVAEAVLSRMYCARAAPSGDIRSGDGVQRRVQCVSSAVLQAIRMQRLRQQ